jgi:hypothetical protein
MTRRSRSVGVCPLRRHEYGQTAEINGSLAFMGGIAPTVRKRMDFACKRHPAHRTSRASAGGEVGQPRPLTCPRGSSVIDNQKGFLRNRYLKAVVTKFH